METMTREQNEEWQAAINPLDYLDFHAVSWEGQREAAERLVNWGVPAWAILLRNELISGGWYEEEWWVPKFALRSEIALVGLQILYPYSVATERIQQQVFVRFVEEALWPFVEHSQQAGPYLQEGYAPLVELYALCGQYHRYNYPSRFPWPRVRELFPQRELDTHQPESREIFLADSLGRQLLQTLEQREDPDDKRYWDSKSVLDIERLVESLNEQHQWRNAVASGYSHPDGTNYGKRVASAFLMALEAWCPAPDWLPNVSVIEV